MGYLIQFLVILILLGVFALVYKHLMGGKRQRKPLKTKKK